MTGQPQTPSTEAGSVHLNWLLAGNDIYPDDALAVVLAIEAEARADNPEWDGTDAAHPAWWRGSDHTAKMMKDQIAALRSALKWALDFADVNPFSPEFQNARALLSNGEN